MDLERIEDAVYLCRCLLLVNAKIIKIEDETIYFDNGTYRTFDSIFEERDNFLKECLDNPKEV